MVNFSFVKSKRSTVGVHRRLTHVETLRWRESFGRMRLGPSLTSGPFRDIT